MAEVFRARDICLDRMVAVKTQREDLARFRRESGIFQLNRNPWIELIGMLANGIWSHTRSTARQSLFAYDHSCAESPVVAVTVVAAMG